MNIDTTAPGRAHSPNDTSTTARQVHDDIEQSLHLRKTDSSDVSGVEDRLKAAGSAAWRTMKRHPFVACVALAVGGAALAASVGVAELTFGGALAFAAYKVLREGEPPMKALADVEHGLAPG